MIQTIYTVEFRIFDIDPASITKDLGLEPCQIWTKGTERVRGRVDPNMWAYNGSCDKGTSWQTLEEGLNFVLSKLVDRHQAIQKYKEIGGRIIWWCGQFHSGFDAGMSLSPLLLRKLSEFGAELFIDSYCQGEGKRNTSD